MKELHIITDLQYGSTGKGLLAGYLAEKLQPDTIVTAWSPNAGHTYMDSDNLKFINTALPNGIVSKNLKRILLGPGSVINPGMLQIEMDQYAGYIYNVDIMIHENAAVVTQEHRDAEAQYMYGIGSTMKGVGEAVVEKIRRRPMSNIIARDAFVSTPFESMVVSASVYDKAVDDAEIAILEGAQGFSLSINQGFYPYTTSRDCTTHQLLSDCAIPWRRHRHQFTKVYGCARTYPIRVANRFDVSGKQIGTSGPCYDDQKEIGWVQLGMEPELTTVTKLPRRIFTFSKQQLMDAVRMNGVDEIFLNFVNYINLDTDPEAMALKDYFRVVHIAGSTITHMGIGPTFNDVVEV